MPSLRPLAILAGGLGCFQAIVWSVLSLLGILVYTGDLQPELFSVPVNFKYVLLNTYFISPRVWNMTVCVNPDLLPMTPETVVVWTSIYFATSVIWLWISALLLNDSYISKFTSKIILSWVAVSAVVVVIDLAGTVAFGMDYDKLESVLGTLHVPVTDTDYYLLAPIFMMMMCIRGFILWIMNAGLVIYLGVVAKKLNNLGSPNLLQEPEYSSHRTPFDSNNYSSFVPSLISPPKADSPSQGRNNAAF